MISQTDREFLALAIAEARKGFDEGGIPAGAVLVEDGQVVAKGRNRRVQQSDPIAHAEMDCIHRAGRRTRYKGLTLYTTLSPCMMCAGTVVHFKIPRVLVGETENFFGAIDFLRANGVEVLVADVPECKSLLRRYIEDNPQLWSENIALD